MNQNHFHESYQHYDILGEDILTEPGIELRGDWYYRILGNWNFRGVWQPALCRQV